MTDCCICLYTVVFLVLAISFYLLRRWANGGRCNSNARLDGKIVIITGANTGIGKETAVDLAKRGGTIIMACRDVNRGESALKDVKERSGSNNVFLKILDLASLQSIHEFSKSFLTEYEKLHILVNNAGIMMCPYIKTQDGFEMQLGVNHFGHFALTNLLLERMVQSAPSRIVNVSSSAHEYGLRGERGIKINFDDIHSEKSYNNSTAYSQSKLANVLFTKELDRKMSHRGVTTYSLHPGVIKTELTRHAMNLKLMVTLASPFLLKTIEQGAQTQIFCAVQEDIENQSGQYFSDCALKKSSLESYDEGMAKKLWEVSEGLTGVKFPF